jgi:hypothetical protein
MEEIFQQLRALAWDFTCDAEECIAGDAEAGDRSRETCLKMEKMFKEWRKESLKVK